MSKIAKIGSALIILVLCSLACGSAKVDEVKQWPTEVPVIEPTAVPIETPAIEPTVTPTVEPTATPDTSILLYNDSIMDIMADWSTGYSQFSELFTAAGNDVGLMDDPAWLGNIYGTMELMTAANARLRTLVPPEQFVPSHQALLEAATHTDTAISLLRTGIAAKNIPAILAATEQIKLATEDIEKATVLLSEITLLPAIDSRPETVYNI